MFSTDFSRNYLQVPVTRDLEVPVTCDLQVPVKEETISRLRLANHGSTKPLFNLIFVIDHQNG